MTHMQRYCRLRSASTFVLGIALMGAACDDGGSSSGGGDMTAADGGDDSNGGSSMTEPSGDDIDEAVLAMCPQQAILLETSEWPTCVEGRSIAGVEPFNNMPCELKIGKNGVFEYFRDGKLALSVPDRSKWQGAFGTYSNENSAGRRAFLASISPDLPVVEGQPRVTNITISLYSEIVDDNVEVEFIDAALARQTYNCTPDLL